MGQTLYIATRKGLFTVERNGGHSGWQVNDVSFLGDPVLIVHPDRHDQRVYAALGHGHYGVKLHRANESGKWEECAAPAYPTPPEGTDDHCPMSQREIPWRTEQIWAMASGGADQPGRLWCGTVPGALFRSDDQGSSWEIVRSLWDHPSRKRWFGGGLDYPGLHSICVDPRNSAHVIVGISCGGVWQTHDDGATWSLCADGMIAEYMPPDQQGDAEIQDPHCVAMCHKNPDHMWVQHHNGVFRTTDGARNWQEIKPIAPSDFGFAVSVHPRDSDTAWFVPAIKDELRVPVDGKLVVTRTRDGGKSFDILRNGLPQCHAYDIVFRHSLDVDESGDVLAFGTTTGAVYVSEDSGDRWARLDAQLPPVYCVRFG
ncbi:MAG: WD40/YVTN/BNR-like repeat-containing protein [Planctomycetota bacterium]|jgi:photosystem II stability/assembly factor-like uncharacterized protein